MTLHTNPSGSTEAVPRAPADLPLHGLIPYPENDCEDMLSSSATGRLWRRSVTRVLMTFSLASGGTPSARSKQ